MPNFSSSAIQARVSTCLLLRHAQVYMLGETKNSGELPRIVHEAAKPLSGDGVDRPPAESGATDVITIDTIDSA